MGFITCIMMCCTQVLYPGPTWTKNDAEILKGAQARCREIYPRSPCLTKFTKVEDQVYQAICGRNNN